MDILALLQCLQPYVPATTLRQCSRIVRTLLMMTGRITMLGMSRWAGKGGSYRTIQRFFATVLPWGLLFWVFFRHQVYCPGDVYLVAGDDVIVTKAGKHTHGLDRFFASLYGKPVPGLAFFTLSLVSVQARRAFPLRVEQVVRSDAEKAARKAKAAAKKVKAPSAKRRPGRPKGSKNKPKSRRDLDAGVRAYCRLARRLAASDRWGHPVDLLGARRALRQPPRPADGAAEPSAPDFQAAVRCRAVRPRLRPLCRAGSPPQVWPQDRLRPPPGALPQRDHGRGAHPDLCLPGAAAPQGIPAAAECGHHR